MPWYKAGTVTVTNGSKNITGLGTHWANGAVPPGAAFSLVDANGAAVAPFYEVDSVTDDTHIALKTNYSGATAAGAAYAMWNLAGELTSPYLAAAVSALVEKNKSIIDDAEASAELAKQWAIKTSGMVDTTEYSAKHYAEAAATSATDAETASSDALAAKNTAVSASGTATTAKNTAVDAKNAAQSAQTAAESAKADAEAAQTAAGTSATNAAASATAAANSAASIAFVPIIYTGTKTDAEITALIRAGDIYIR